MLGRLARWLRTMGYDCEYDSRIEDDALIARANKDDRVILTRDTRLAARRVARGRTLLIRANGLDEQVREVKEAFVIDAAGLLTRCLRCNTPLEEMPKEAAMRSVPAFVYDTQESFSRCHSCGRIYWAGTHIDTMKREVDRLLNG
ncbi:MAG: hypothetical protein A3J24_01895 [Deltaproteobacteria bacterium RIFCSPLOWO2_02_FULL_53_8]|nr:MAG: hypothetical protein A3J24_01895 [Deltaproteobacteria bacterium RIFCSPLOWO2_02_FULL_53_8]